MRKDMPHKASKTEYLYAIKYKYGCDDARAEQWYKQICADNTFAIWDGVLEEIDEENRRWARAICGLV